MTRTQSPLQRARTRGQMAREGMSDELIKRELERLRFADLVERHGLAETPALTAGNRQGCATLAVAVDTFNQSVSSSSPTLRAGHTGGGRPMSTRTVAWFSAGAASAVATKLAIADDPETVVAYCDPGSEHPDNRRFLADCEQWFGRPVTILHSDTYVDTWDVWQRRRYLVGHKGTLCTVELKKRLRQRFEQLDDRQVFGYTAEEADRVERFRAANPDVELVTPLLERGLGKADCLALVERAGLELPAMYRLGYHNANCIGCPHGGLGYWNKIRRDFPDTFDRMATLERDIGHACNKDTVGPVWLDQLDPARGNIDDELVGECSLLCVLAEGDIEAPR